MKKQMKTSLFTVALGLSLTGVVLSSSTNKRAATTANQAPLLPVMPATTQAAVPNNPAFTVYLSLVTAFTNGQSIDYNVVSGDHDSSIWDKMTNWREAQ